MSVRRWILLGITLVLAALLCAGLVAHRRIFTLVRGFEAGHMCSGVFVSGRPPEAVLQQEIRGVHSLARDLGKPLISRDRLETWAPAMLLVPNRTAVHTECCGCVLLPPGASREDLRGLPGEPTHLFQRELSGDPWPRGDRHETPPDPCVKEAVRDSFGVPGTLTTGVVVVREGQIIAESYAPGFDAATPTRTWSTAKSLAGALTGVAVARGRLVLDAPLPIRAWGPDDPRRAITPRHLLHMSSGLASPGERTIEAYWGGTDSAALAAAARLEAEPGTRFRYSNYDTLLLVRALRETLGDRAYWRLPRETLFEPLHMRHTIAEMDPYGNFILSSQVYTTPRDLARFALLYLHDGVWNGERILPEGWVEFSTAPAPASLTLPESHRAHASYGAQLWLLGRDPALPDDTYTTSGARGQHATLVPSRELVVVRMGLDPLMQENAWDQGRLVADVLSCFRDRPGDF